MQAVTFPLRMPTVAMAQDGAVFRLYMGGAALLSSIVALTDADSLMHPVTLTSEGAALIWLLMAMGAALAVDAAANDLLSARYHWRAAMRQRHFILAALSFGYVAQLYVVSVEVRSTTLLLYYLWNAGVIMLSAFLDAHQRAKDAICDIDCN